MEIETLILTVSVTEFYQEGEEIGHDRAMIVSKDVFFTFYFLFIFLTWERLICGRTEEKIL